VNPMQGEGISQAMTSGRAAAVAILSQPSQAAQSYRSRLADEHLPYHQIAAAVHAGLVGRPRATAAVARLLTAAGRSNALSGGWAVFWNELLDGAPPNRHRSVANAVTHAGRAMTARGATARWFRSSVA
jgi:flavin-dependent dehydrogenase